MVACLGLAKGCNFTLRPPRSSRGAQLIATKELAIRGRAGGSHIVLEALSMATANVPGGVL